MFQPEFEQMQRSDLETLQLERLKATLERISSRNRFYSEKLNNLTSQDIGCLEDIQQFPLMTKDDLRMGYPFKYACADHNRFHAHPYELRYYGYTDYQSLYAKGY